MAEVGALRLSDSSGIPQSKFHVLTTKSTNLLFGKNIPSHLGVIPKGVLKTYVTANMGINKMLIRTSEGEDIAKHFFGTGIRTD